MVVFTLGLLGWKTVVNIITKWSVKSEFKTKYLIFEIKNILL